MTPYALALPQVATRPWHGAQAVQHNRQASGYANEEIVPTREDCRLSTSQAAGETGHGTDAHDDTNEEAVLRFVERFALLLTEAGLSRMSARVFAYVLADDAESYTARELADGLRVSPAAISGAVRPLVQSGLLAKERAPGGRVDHYRVYDDDVWTAILRQRQPFIERNLEVLAEGAELIGAHRAGGRRVRETYEFYRFLNEELIGNIERWREHRRRWLAQEYGQEERH